MIFDLYFENNLNHIKELDEKTREQEGSFIEEAFAEEKT